MLVNQWKFEELSDALKRKVIFEEQNGQCNKCGNDKWLGELIPLELEHIDGDNTNNCRENLEFLCPNCHRLTHTWGGRNKKESSRYILDEEYVEVLNSVDNIRQALIELKLTPKGSNYIRAKKLIKEYNIKHLKHYLQ